MLISLHLPKTAGSSFRATLEQCYGDRLRLEYEERPLHLGNFERRRRAVSGCIGNALGGLQDSRIECIHGHFLPLRYRWLRGCSREQLQFVTWMRDPVQRLMSHYHYWRRSYNPDTAPRLHRLMIEEDWSIETFATREELRNIYARFLWGFPLRRFDFIGISEDYDSELKYFGERFLHTSLRTAAENVNPAKTSRAYDVPEALRQQIVAAHAIDFRLYDRALKLREQR